MSNVIIEDIEIVKNYLQGAHKILGNSFIAAYWFGSRSRGEGRSDSDYDLLIETKKVLTPKQRDAMADIAVDIAADHGALLDVHFYTQEEILHTPIGRSPFVMAIHKDGVRL
ncbi:MAG: nucleotidyltransferase domain-containing protein [Verrucomicrobiae bacterium]|nr:nucleotidyltransferase domain-containing protein [Verrucomicrobiae bacterium]